MSPAPTADSFAVEIRERGPAIERDRRMPADLAGRMAEAGLFRYLVPEAYGGFEVHPRLFFDTLVNIARQDGAVGWCTMIAQTTAMMSASLPPVWATAIYRDNPAVVTTGVTAPLGKAEPVEGGLVVSGRWPFGSGAEVSDWICGGTIVMEKGEPRRNRHGGPETVLPFFPAAEVTVHDTWHTSGLCGTGSNDIEVRDAFVPDGRWAVLGERARVDRPLYRFPTLGLLALGVSAVSVGIAEHALETFAELAAGKVPTGSTRSLAQRSGAQKDVARARALTRSATAYVHEAVDAAYQQAQSAGKLGRDHKAELRLAATNAAWSAAQAVDLVYHAAGGSAIYHSNDLQRCFRDVHVATQHIMVAQPTYEVVGKVALGIDPKTLL